MKNAFFSSEDWPGYDPDEGEDAEYRITSPLVVDISEHLGQLQQRVGHVVEDHHQGADPSEVVCPGEHHQQDGGIVVDHHLQEVLPPHIKELWDGEGPVEGELHHVVAPDVARHGVVGIVVPAVPDTHPCKYKGLMLAVTQWRVS